METVNVLEVLLPELTILDKDTFADKDELFTYMSSKVEEIGIGTVASKVTAALYDREEEGTTCLGNCLAMPHGLWYEVVHPGVGFCRVKTPFLYRSHDEEGEVKFIFTMAVCGEDGKMQHLRILAALAQLLAHDEFLERLGEVKDYDELIEEIQKTQESVE